MYFLFLFCSYVFFSCPAGDGLSAAIVAMALAVVQVARVYTHTHTHAYTHVHTFTHVYRGNKRKCKP